MQKTILVVGATGTLGQFAARSLKEAGFGVRIMTRDTQKASKLFDSTFEIFAEDPTDASCLEAALDGCYGVHISLPGQVEQQVAETAAKIAPKHAIERITYISGATVAEQNRWFPMVNQKFLAEKAIRESGVPYTFICPTWVMESLPMFVVAGRASMFGKQPCPYHWVAADDLACMVTNAYGQMEAASQRLRVFGPEPIRMQEALMRYCAVFQPEIKKLSSMPFWLVNLLAAMLRNQELKAVGEMMSYFEKIGEGSQPTETNDILGTPMTTLDVWLKQRKANIALANA